jgi:hypothetical protein
MPIIGCSRAGVPFSTVPGSVLEACCFPFFLARDEPERLLCNFRRRLMWSIARRTPMAITTNTTPIVMPALAPTLRPEDFGLDEAVGAGAGAMLDGMEYMVEYDPVAISKGMEVNVDKEGLFVGVDEAVVII